MSNMAGLDKRGLRRVINAVRRDERRPRESLRPGYGNPASRREAIDAIITDVTAINGGIRARYKIRFGHWDMEDGDGGGTWVADSAIDFKAFLEAEDKNTFTSGTGTIGTGNTAVAQADGTIGSTSCKLKFLPIGAHVTVKVRGVKSGGTLYFTIVGQSNSAQ
jgi:hypothetical protein